MLKHIRHGGGVMFEDEIQFRTPFDYMFPEQARAEEGRLPASEATLHGLLALGQAMADPGTQGDEVAALNSAMPAVFTYLGQFIDHDITANTDRETGISDIVNLDGTAKPLKPLNPDKVIANLTNGRRLHLDLDSVYGDGPGLIGNHVVTAAQILYENDLKLKIYQKDGMIDLPRNPKSHRAIIADMRNDENVIVSQLHTAFLKFSNAAADSLSEPNNAQTYSRARQLTRWAYQSVVVHDYLPTVCDPNVVADILANGPRFYKPAVTGGEMFMPLEFSVAAFRFGHSMIRPFYQLNDATTRNIDELLEASRHVDPGTGQLSSEFRVEWNRFVEGSDGQKARRINPRLAQGLFKMPFGPDILAHLARRNLLRGYLLSIPTGQAVAHAMGIQPLSEEDLLCEEPKEVRDAFGIGGFGQRTPLWFYILKEAHLHNEGNGLGAVGSRIVAETLLGLIKQDQNSYLNSCDDAVTKEGVSVCGMTVNSVQSFLKAAGVLSGK